MIKLFRTRLLIAISLLCAACGGGGDNSSATGATNPPTNWVYRPAQNASEFNNVLVDCLSVEPQAHPCTIGTLPFIGQKTSVPTKSSILAQTIVSHPWMATRFGQVLDQMPADIFLLFRGVTGVVIGANIRPSHYDAVTGAIYLDPADLWVTAEERNTISQAPDFRSGFGNGLAFAELWRYVQGNHYAWNSLPLNTTVGSRPLSDLTLPMAALLFHELAHANDFTQPALLSQLDPQKPPFGNASTAFPSTDLSTRLPLRSTLLLDFGKILYHGMTATDAQKLITGDQIGFEFATDGANAGYSYSSKFEDTAMLFEEVMMKHHYDIDREEGFSTLPVNSNSTCSDFIVRWGQRNRIGDPQVKMRAEYVVRQILGISDASAYINSLPTPRNLSVGVDWCTNLQQMVASRSFRQIIGGSNGQTSAQQPINPSDLLPPHGY